MDKTLIVHSRAYQSPIPSNLEITMPQYRNIYEAKADVSRKPCKVTGCGRNRDGVAGYCGRHRVMNYLYGHPLARALPRKDYLGELEEVRRVVMANPDHPGIRSKLDLLGEWLDMAGRGLKVPAGFFIQGLHDQRVKPMDMLVEAGTVWLLRHRLDPRIPSDKALTKMTGYRVLRLATIGRTPGNAHKTVGTYIRDNMGVLLLNICETADRVDRERNQDLKEQSEPLTV